MELVRNPYFDCFQINIYALLKYLNKNNNLFWHEAGLIYEVDESTGKPECYTNYKYFVDVLDDFHIDTYIISIEEPSLVLDKAKNTLIHSSNLFLELDSFELPYSLSYKENHDTHWIEVVGYDEESLHIVDQYFKFVGSLSFNEVIKAIISLKQYKKNNVTKLMTFKNRDNNEYFSNEWLMKNIDNNKRAMCESYVGQHIFYSKKSYVGFQALDQIKIDVNHLITNLILTPNDDNLLSILDSYLVNIKSIANSRFNYGNYLKEIGLSNKSDICLNLYQQYIVISNILLKAYYVHRFETVKLKINKRFDRIKDLELKLCE